MINERKSPAADPMADLDQMEADYTDATTGAALESEERMPEPPANSGAEALALAHQQLERDLNAHLGGGVEVRADGAIVIESRLIMVETVDLAASGKVVIRRRDHRPSTTEHARVGELLTEIGSTDIDTAKRHAAARRRFVRGARALALGRLKEREADLERPVGKVSMATRDLIRQRPRGHTALIQFLAHEWDFRSGDSVVEICRLWYQLDALGADATR